MAAGEGVRLRPLTERWPKPVLPIDGRPVIATLLRELAAAGIERAIVVVGHLADQVEAIVRDELAFPLEVRVAEQPERLGSADAVLHADCSPPFLLTAADTVYHPGDVGRFLAALDPRAVPGAIAVRRQPERPDHTRVRVQDGSVVRVRDPAAPGDLTAAPLMLVGAPVARELPAVTAPPFHPPYEVADAFQRVIDAGGEVPAIEIAPTRDLTNPYDLVRENFPYLRGSESTYTLFQQGKARLSDGMAAQATVALEKAKRREPSKASIREALGIAYFRLRRWSEAEVEFRKVLELAPTDDYAHYALGRCLEKQGRATEANGHYKLANSLRPGSRRYSSRVRDLG